MKLMLSKMKKLFIWDCELKSGRTFNFGLNLEHFQHLEQLQIMNLRIHKSGSVNLPNLKTLSINNVTLVGFSNRLHDTSLTIETPNLFAFETEVRIVNGPSFTLKNFKFLYPDKITYLKIRQMFFDSDLLKNFVNLKYLFFKFRDPSSTSHYYGKEVSEIFIKSFSDNLKLAELHFDFIGESSLSYLFKANKSKTKIFLKGQLIESLDDIDSHFNEKGLLIELNSKSIALNYFKAYHLQNLIFEINFTDLVSILGVIPDDFHTKFINLFKVTVDECKNQEIFFDFIKKIKSLRVLKINKASFDQSFYDNLKYCCPYLGLIDIKEPDISDFRFLCECKNLQKIFIRQNVDSLDQIKNIIVELKEIYHFVFYFKGKKFEVSQGNGGISYDLILSNHLVTFKKLINMIEFLKNLYYLK